MDRRGKHAFISIGAAIFVGLLSDIKEPEPGKFILRFTYLGFRYLMDPVGLWEQKTGEELMMSLTFSSKITPSVHTAQRCIYDGCTEEYEYPVHFRLEHEPFGDPERFLEPS